MATWTALTYAYGSLLTSTKMTQNQDNFTALAEGAAGAPNIATAAITALAVTEAKIAASAVAQGKLKTTTATGSVSVGPGAANTYSLTGGTYAWWTAGANGATITFGDASNPAAGVLGVYNTGGGTGTFEVDERYVQASPPYNNGPLFVHLALDSLGKIVHSRIAPDPIHAYHGPTNIAPQYYKKGKPYRKVKKINGLSEHAALRDPVTLAAILAGTATVTEDEVEITLDYKDSDAVLFPHPFIGNDLTGLTVVMLEPGTILMQKLAEFCDCGEAREVRDLIIKDKLIIENTPLAVPKVPKEVMVVRAKWKLT